eukprot:TRINITY_DN37218_c0_g1_i1.p1 TRINITY_DN37218_c0_g1~~TRINITY_DN37218_c0_g1_i1.p1  ORF type:complete len:354 (+),score=13.99 TRINITY_DN37218_c0_g1_i1:116-1177(+)
MTMELPPRQASARVPRQPTTDLSHLGRADYRMHPRSARSSVGSTNSSPRSFTRHLSKMSGQSGRSSWLFKRHRSSGLSSSPRSVPSVDPATLRRLSLQVRKSVGSKVSCFAAAIAVAVLGWWDRVAAPPRLSVPGANVRRSSHRNSRRSSARSSRRPSARTSSIQSCHTVAQMSKSAEEEADGWQVAVEAAVDLVLPEPPSPPFRVRRAFERARRTLLRNALCAVECGSGSQKKIVSSRRSSASTECGGLVSPRRSRTASVCMKRYGVQLVQHSFATVVEAAEMCGADVDEMAAGWGTYKSAIRRGIGSHGYLARDAWDQICSECDFGDGQPDTFEQRKSARVPVRCEVIQVR